MTVEQHVHLGVAPAPRVTVHDVRPAHVDGASLTDLVTVARRDNPRRQVLFVSTVLGKHLAVDPGLPILAGLTVGELVQDALGDPTGQAFGARLADALRAGRPVDPGALAASTGAAGERCIVLGFAETATGLTHAVRRSLGVGPVGHTTRVADGRPLFTVTEAHSHAIGHSVHHDDSKMLRDGAPVVVVDDEFTTGATALDMVLAIQRRWPRQRYVLASLIDWRPPERRREMVDAVAASGAQLDSVSLIDAEIEIGAAPALHDLPAAVPVPSARAVGADVIVASVGPPTARRGWTAAHQETVEERVAEVAGLLASRRHGDRALVVGLEELMYVPMLLGVHLGPGARTCSTTRSPVVPARADGYPIVDRVEFPPTDDTEGTRYLYNLADQRYDDVVVVTEDHPLPRHHPLLSHLAQISDHLHVLRLT